MGDQIGATEKSSGSSANQPNHQQHDGNQSAAGHPKLSDGCNQGETTQRETRTAAEFVAVALQNDPTGDAACGQHTREEAKVLRAWPEGVGRNQGCQTWVKEANHANQAGELQHVS